MDQVTFEGIYHAWYFPNPEKKKKGGGGENV